MANKKIDVEKLIANLNPPKWKIWVTPKVRQESARSLGRMKKGEALEPLIEMLSDEKVGDAAMEAISDLTIPPKLAAKTLKAVLSFRQGLKVRYIDEFFHEDRNSSTMKLIGDMPVSTMKAEPEGFLGAALSIWSQLNPDRAGDLETAASRGLAPYSRKKFRQNANILADLDIFPSWPALDIINNLFEITDSLIVGIAGPEALPDYEPKTEGDEGQENGGASRAPKSLEATQQEMDDFVLKALSGKAATTVPMKQIPVIMNGFFKELKVRYPLLDASEIFKLLSGAIRLNCHQCGPLATEYTQGLLNKVSDRFGRDDGSIEDLLDSMGAGSFAKGHGPGCLGTGVEMAFDPAGIEAPAKAIELQREAAEGKSAAKPEEAKAAAESPAPQESPQEPQEETVASEEAAPEPALYHVIYKGEVLEGKDIEEVKKGIAALYKVDVAKVAAFFSGKPKVIKKGVDEKTAQKMVAAFGKVGAKAYIQKDA